MTFFPDLTWTQFIQCCTDSPHDQFEHMTRNLFIDEYLNGNDILHSDASHPGIEVEPVLEPPHQDGTPRRLISFQSKFFINKVDYMKIMSSAEQAIKHYKGKLDLIYLFCNLPINMNRSSTYKKTVQMLADAGIELKLISGNAIFDMLQRHERIARIYFLPRSRTYSIGGEVFATMSPNGKDETAISRVNEQNNTADSSKYGPKEGSAVEYPSTINAPSKPELPEGLITVPDVIDMEQTEAAKLIESCGLMFKVWVTADAALDFKDFYYIIEQNPGAGSMVKPGSVVSLRLSAKKPGNLKHAPDKGYFIIFDDGVTTPIKVNRETRETIYPDPSELADEDLVHVVLNSTNTDLSKAFVSIMLEDLSMGVLLSDSKKLSFFITPGDYTVMADLGNGVIKLTKVTIINSGNYSLTFGE